MSEITQDLVTMPVRIPKKLVRELKAIQEDLELPSLGAALKAYLDKIQLEGISKRIAKVEKLIAETQAQNYVLLGHNTGSIEFLKKALSTFAEKNLNRTDLVENLLGYSGYENMVKLAKILLEYGGHTDNVNCGMYSWLTDELVAIANAKQGGQKKTKGGLD